MAVEVYQDGDGADGGLFGLGAPNETFAQYFIGNSYLKPLTDPKQTVFMANVTLSPDAGNNWHIHKASKGGGQILLCTDGRVGIRSQEAGEPIPAMWLPFRQA